MNKHTKKIIMPIIITIIFIAYLVFYGYMVMITTNKTVTIVLFVLLCASGIGMIYTLLTRIKEIRSGEEDDLSDY